MPLKSPGTSYTGKPVRRLKLPKIGRTRTKSLVEEYFYLLLALVFLSVAILGKAVGFSTYNALIVAAWLTALIWFAQQWRAYLAEKSKPENEKKDRKSTRLNSSHQIISYAVFCLKKKKNEQ